MKKATAYMALLMALLLLCPPAAPMASAATAGETVPSGDTLVYALPDTASLCVGVAPGGVALTVLETANGFYKVEVNGKTGYVPVTACNGEYTHVKLTAESELWDEAGQSLGTAAADTVMPLLSDEQNGRYAVTWQEAATYVDSGNVQLLTRVQAEGTQARQYPITVTLPSGYEDTTVLWVDGVKYEGTASQGALTVQVTSDGANVATAYHYTSAGVADGMYVWLLTYSDESGYAAQAQPGLKDLISYHGFSIRVAGESGIRFKSGISKELRTRLLGDGVEGIKLTEYGTLVTGGTTAQNYPFNLECAKVNSGRAYWTENGKTYDKVAETVNGRLRFTSVMTGLPQTHYNTQFAFRGYAKLTDGTRTYTVYGPPVARSIYQVAQQLEAANAYAMGTDAYYVVSNIISLVEFDVPDVTALSTVTTGSTGDAVKAVQHRLIQLGYLDVGDATGNFGSDTLLAVWLFQCSNGISATGTVADLTYSKLFKDTAVAFDGDMSVGRVDWFSVVNGQIPRQGCVLVTDVDTGLSYIMRRLGGNYHCDVEPLTKWDTNTFKSTYGSWSWTRRAVAVTLPDGTRYAGSVNGMPHGSDTLPDNGMSGQVCLHFYNSRTHGGDNRDPDHHAMIDKAYEAYN